MIIVIYVFMAVMMKRMMIDSDADHIIMRRIGMENIHDQKPEVQKYLYWSSPKFCNIFLMLDIQCY